MPAKLLFIRTIDKLVVSESSATAGQHKSLDYIPGSALLGAIAAKIYRKLPDTQTQWAVFHSGMMRFGNAYPAALPPREAGASTSPCLPAWPAPLSYHAPKNASSFVKTILNEEEVVDLSAINASEQANVIGNRQFKQVRGKYISCQLQEVSTQSDYQLKTAIDYNKGSANDGQLYGYHTLAAEQWFAGELSWDDQFENDYPQALETVLNLLQGEVTPNEPLRLGRAKSAEFGRVAMQIQNYTPLPVAVNEGELLRLFCLSDIALKDPSGQPILTLSATHLGLPSERLVLQEAQCFVGTRQYSVYNAKRGAYDQQRQVISKGSVFVFKIAGDVRDIQAQLSQQLQRGVGMYTESGLGQLRSQLTIPEYPELQPVQLPVFTTQLETPLTQWLSRKSGHSKTQAQAMEQSAELLEKLRKMYTQGRTLSMVASSDPWGPNKHNWSMVLSTVKQAKEKNNQALLDSLCKGKGAIIRWTLADSEDKNTEDYSNNKDDKFKKDDNWQQLVVDNHGRYISFAEWFYLELKELAGTSNVRLYAVIQLLARKAMSENLGTGSV